MELDGREAHLIARALAIAIQAIDRADPKVAPLSDREEMARLIERFAPSDTELALYSGSAKKLLDSIQQMPKP